MKHISTLYGLLLFFYLGMDMIWLNVFAKDFYTSQIGNLLLPRPVLGVAALVYLLYPMGLLYFVVDPALRSAAQPWTVALSGALLGLLVYGTYDATNLATLKGWTISLALVDVLWGAFVSGVASGATFFIFKRFFA